MSKKSGLGWSEKDLQLRGITPNNDGTYSRKVGGETVTRKSISDLHVKEDLTFPLKERNVTNLTDTTTVSTTIKESVLVINGLVAGLNGDKGLMRSHWSNTKKQKDLYQLIIKDHLRENKVRKHTGKVTIHYVGYKSVLMDWDNFCSSFKHIGDSLVESGIITEDKPSVVVQFIPHQIKCKRVDQKVVVIIKDYV